MSNYKFIWLTLLVLIGLSQTTYINLKCYELAKITKNDLLNNLSGAIVLATQTKNSWLSKGYKGSNYNTLGKDIETLQQMKSRVSAADPTTPDGQECIETNNQGLQDMQKSIQLTIINGNQELGKQNRQHIDEISNTTADYQTKLTNFLQKIPEKDELAEKYDTNSIKTLLKSMIDYSNKLLDIIGNL
ncbi:uncharacterized protein LOC128957158 [Oppia nitens]|uniref:uncharacterized protein LOC128957158 n=1 Tax=Oppia nitens TaxID=1686743 RepID=UPI0023DBCBD1|nr:uncharacterized protein LOC128957158 [Oppia nitens]